MKISFLLCGLIAVLASGCKPQSAAPPSQKSPARIFSVHGVIRQIPPDHRHATIQHEKIPGYMAAMTMDFSVRDTNALAGLVPGDEINFNLVVTDDDDWIESLQRTGKTTGVSGPPGWHVVEPELQVGDLLPDAEFTSENGRIIHLSDFRGQALAFTFFFTSCPLPEFCPRMNKNFAEVRKLLLADTNAATNWQLLSVSFDSAFDEPVILASYASLYRGTNADRWVFAVASTNTLTALAPRLDFRYWRDAGVLSHNLRTIVLDGSGKIFRQFDGNDWTAAELAKALSTAAKQTER